MSVRVAQIIDDVGLGGAERLLAVSARALLARGVHVDVISLRAIEPSPAYEGLRGLGIDVIEVPSRRTRELLDRKRTAWLRSLLRERAYDVVQTHLLYANVAGPIAARGAHTPVVATLHQTAPNLRRHEYARELLEATVLRRYATRVVAVGPTVANAYRRRLGRVPLDVVATPPITSAPTDRAVVAHLRAELLGDQPGPLLLSLSRLEPVKGIDDLITAFAKVRASYPGAVLVLAGDGRARAALEHQARATEVADHIHFLGERNDVPSLLRAADLFVMSSRSEGRPLALLEALGAGLFAVATNVGDVPTMLGERGIVVAPNDPDALASAIGNALTERPSNARRADNTQAEEERWVERMLDVYRAAMTRHLIVGTLTHGYKPRIGGIESQRAATSARLAQLGVEPHVYTRAYACAPTREVLDGVAVHRLAGAPTWCASRASDSLVWSARAFVHLLRLRPNIIQADEILSTARVALAAGRVLRVPVVVVAHSSGPHGDVGRKQNTRLLASVRRRAALVIAVNEHIDAEVAALGIEPARRRVLPNGVDVETFAPATAGEREHARADLKLHNTFAVLFTGRLAPEKRLDRAIDVWRRDPQLACRATLVIVGSGPEESRLRANAPAGVRFVGSTTDVRPYLHAADAFVLPSDVEGVSCALLEAQAMGLPAVATDVGAARDVIRDGVTGFVVEPDTFEARLRALVDDPPTAQAMGIHARARTLQHFSLDATARALKDIYEAIA